MVDRSSKKFGELTFIYFSYNDDIKLLTESVRSVRRVYPKAKMIVFWEEGRAAHLEGVTNLVSHFDRKRNLNGIECVRGMIDCFLSAKGTIVKIDSDTILTKPLPYFENFLFFEGFRAFTGAGLCYAIERNVLIECKKVLDAYSPLPADKYPEDSTISALCHYVTWGTLKLFNSCEYICGYANDMNWDKIKDKTLVHFGNEDKSLDPASKKGRDAGHMKLFNNFLDSNGNF